MKSDRNKDAVTSRFRPKDFADVFAQLPPGCPLVGGQAVAWWAERYGITEGQEPITSEDIDFWGSRGDLEKLAARLSLKPIFPHAYEMTVWAGAIPLKIRGQKSLAEFLHSVPGLDIIDPDQASIEVEFSFTEGRRLIQVLSPVSLVLTKLHALRHFDQEDRQDELHLKVCLRASAAFLSELMGSAELRHFFWNAERLIAAHRLKAYRRLEKKHGVDILSGVPIDQVQAAGQDLKVSQDDRKRLLSFLNRRWKQARGS